MHDNSARAIVTFVGGGNMASAMLRGLFNKQADSLDLRVADPAVECREQLSQQFPDLRTYDDNAAAIEGADLVVLAVKPQIIETVSRALRSNDSSAKTVFVSVAAGTTLATLKQALGTQSVMRAMPNQPAILGLGVTALFAGPEITDSAKALAEEVLGACGIVIPVHSEREIDAATAISGSGPAYFYTVMDALIDAALKLGFSPEIARILVAQTAAGAAAVAVTDPASLDELLARVTSPGGTTEAGRAALAENHLHAIFERAVKAAYERGQALALDTENSS